MSFTNKILRNFRRFYLNHFKEVTGVTDLASIKNKAAKEQELRNYVISEFGEQVQDIDDVAYRLGTVLAPKSVGWKMFDRRKSNKDIFKVYDTLYKFSITKVENLMNDKSVCLLLDKFMSIEENVERLMDGPEISKDSYRQAISLLKRRIEDVQDDTSLIISLKLD
jgi:hypothetical protein